MDSITQATLGAAIGQAVIGKKIGSTAAIIGAVVATIPDLDVLVLAFYDAVERISIHRGISHSILFNVLVAILLTYILSRIKWTKGIALWRLFIFNCLALFTHIILDAFTAYGTQLFLPWSDYRVSLDSVNIVDPFYTVPLLIGLIVSLYQQSHSFKKRSANRIGLLVSTVYLLFTFFNKQLVNDTVQTQLLDRNISYNSMKTIPVGVGSVNWYGVAKSRDTLYLGKYSHFDEEAIDFHAFPINTSLLEGVNPTLAERLQWFSQGFYTLAEHDGSIRLYNLQCDMQGVRTFGDYKAPTAFYFQITPHQDGSYDLTTGMHARDAK